MYASKLTRISNKRQENTGQDQAVGTLLLQRLGKLEGFSRFPWPLHVVKSY